MLFKLIVSLRHTKSRQDIANKSLKNVLHTLKEVGQRREGIICHHVGKCKTMVSNAKLSKI